MILFLSMFLKTMKYPSDDNFCFRVETVNKLVNNVFQEYIFKDPIEACLVQQKNREIENEEKYNE